jgi:hypothetical protein
MGQGDRINHHIRLAKIHKRKTFKDNIILKILSTGKTPIRFKLYDNITFQSAIRAEKLLIQLIGRRDLDKGTLANLTDGGEGIPNFKMLPQTIAKRKGRGNFFYGKHHTEETKEKIRKTIGDSRKGEKNPNYGKHCSADMKLKLSLSNKGKKTGNENPSKRPEVRQKISQSKLGEANPLSLKWLLISPNGENHIIEGGIKRALKQYGLDYQQFLTTGTTRKNKTGWELRILN